MVFRKYFDIFESYIVVVHKKMQKFEIWAQLMNSTKKHSEVIKTEKMKIHFAIATLIKEYISSMFQKHSINSYFLLKVKKTWKREPKLKTKKESRLRVSP